MKEKHKYYRGDVWIARIGKSPITGKGITRPVVILQNDIGNYYSPTVISAELSDHIRRENLPTHVVVTSGPCAGTMVKTDALRTLKKTALLQFVGRLDGPVIKKVDDAVRASLALSEDESVPTLECICSRCRRDGFNDAVKLRRADPCQVEMELCSYCGQNRGYDFWVFKSKKNPNGREHT